ncbi:hypothetical protein AB205_0193420 [Aquarana catesbeiana]|uniref:Thyroglobulin type-1 domain-containing protein n=1 Tax=Aquarana catesbeiana TaxID=8400 RepID=A0A2G9S4I1_AQUCT|nr:hypothetical protein AB205_0193420 [Aquarana catesbeiana]
MPSFSLASSRSNATWQSQQHDFKGVSLAIHEWFVNGVVLRGLKIFQSLVERESREEDPTTSETEETYPTKPRKRGQGVSDHKAIALNNFRQKKQSASRIVSVENKGQTHSSPEYSIESEMGPCRRQMETVMQDMKMSHRVYPRAFYIPNCDRKGFFKRKQCKPSRGRKRGICWCVDKYGLKLPGSDYAAGDLQCHSFDSSNIE